MAKGKGWIKVDRSLVDHWLWEQKPYSYGQAWIDLLLMANYDEGKTFHDGNVKIVNRGEIICTFEYLAKRLGWDRKKVRKYINALLADKMVTVKSTTHGTTITLVNYGKYQVGGTTKKTTEGTNDGQPLPQPLPTQKENKEINKYIYIKGNQKNKFCDFIPQSYDFDEIEAVLGDKEK